MHFQCELEFDFASSQHALVAKQALEVDAELQPLRQAKVILAEGSTMRVVLSAVDAKSLRVAVSSFFDMALVVTKNLQEFG